MGRRMPPKSTDDCGAAIVVSIHRAEPVCSHCARHLTGASFRAARAPAAHRNEAAKRRMGAPMALLESHLERCESFDRNAERMRGLVADLRQRLTAVREGGGAEATAKHRKRNKLTARERIERLVDAGSD